MPPRCVRRFVQRFPNITLHRDLQLKPAVFSPEKIQCVMFFCKGYDTPCSNAVPRLIRNRNTPLVKGNFSRTRIGNRVNIGVCAKSSQIHTNFRK